MRGAHKSHSLSRVQFQRGKERVRKEITVEPRSCAQLLWKPCCIAITSSRRPAATGKPGEYRLCSGFLGDVH